MKFWKYCFSIFLLRGCIEQEKKVDIPSTTIPLVYASTPFLHFTTKFLGGDLIECIPICKTDPAHCTPSEHTITQMQRANLIVLNGGGYELWSKTKSLPYSTTLITGNAFKKEWLYSKEVSHSHGGEDHVHQSSNPYFWMNTELARKQAYQIMIHLNKVLPENETLFRKNFDSYKDSLDLIEEKWSKFLAENREYPLFCNDEKLSYFCLQFGSSDNDNSLITQSHSASNKYYFKTYENDFESSYFQMHRDNLNRLKTDLITSNE
jgi:ABC-type Zn uptake system ZnuABC Zn-binding protein ZnuA